VSEGLPVRPGHASEPPRIGYVLSLFPCYDETFILREIKALAARGVALQIFSLRRKAQAVVQEDARPFIASTRYAGYASPEVLGAVGRVLRRRPGVLLELLSTIVAGAWRHPTRLLKSLVLVPKAVRFAELAAEQQLERLHAHWATYPATVALVMSRLTGIPWSFTCHAHDIFLNPSLLEEKLERADFVLTCTADNKRHLESLVPAAGPRIQVSYHGLDVELFKPGPTRFPKGPVKLLGVGSLLECKGFDILLEACATLKIRGLDFELTVAGGGPLEESLKASTARLGIAQRVRFTGYVTQKDLVPLYREADVFVLPAVLEIHWGIPNVLVEAAACGLPIVTTALPSLPELLTDGREGLVAENRNPRDLADKLERLIGDPGLRRRMGQAGRLRVEECFDVQKTIDSVIEPLIGRRSAVR